MTETIDPDHMAGPEMRAIRKALGLSLWRFGRALGYQGERTTINAQVRKYECGDRIIPPWIGRLALLLWILHSEYGVHPRDIFEDGEA